MYLRRDQQCWRLSGRVFAALSGAVVKTPSSRRALRQDRTRGVIDFTKCIPPSLGPEIENTRQIVIRCSFQLFRKATMKLVVRRIICGSVRYTADGQS